MGLALCIENMSVRYGQVDVLSLDQCHIDEGQAVGVFGHNGSGKSTLLKAVVGIARSRTTRLEILGTDVSRMPANQRVVLSDVGYVPQSGGLFPELDVRDHLHIADRLKRRRSRVASGEDILSGPREALLGYLESSAAMAKSSVSFLSGGQRRALGLVMAFQPGVRLLMLDEPLAGLAAVPKKLIDEAIREATRLGITVLIVEQNVQETLSMVDRALIFKSGRLNRDGNAAELKDDAELLLHF